MKKSIIFFLIHSAGILVMGEISGYASPMDVNNLKNYNFENLQRPQIQNYSIIDGALTLFVYLLFFILICLLAYVTTRWLAKHQGHLRLKSKYMEVIDHLPLGNNRMIYIIKAPQGLLMVGASEKGLCILDKLGEKETELINDVEADFKLMNAGDFAGHLDGILKKVREHLGKTKNGEGA
ncbi:flagellar biosynthetic protein FliO [Thermoanaerobacterium sp. DL9XJH110]|uniref:flagellar biosynthetic protein FliO n=1 Tax=Thermoanaerobacterium sp. DL9XJH110 TaxID=3386643 RepID=UPI003BB781F8